MRETRSPYRSKLVVTSHGLSIRCKGMLDNGLWRVNNNRERREWAW